MIRLLWDETNNRPVILQERLYSNVASDAIEEAINDMVREKAETMGAILVSKEIGKGMPYLGTIESFGGLAAFVYSDASGGVFGGPFKTENCHVLQKAA